MEFQDDFGDFKSFWKRGYEKREGPERFVVIPWEPNENLLLVRGAMRSRKCMKRWIPSWNPKQPFINGCFNWMIPNLYIGNGCFTKHPFFNGCLGFQAELHSFLLEVGNIFHPWRLWTCST